MAQAQVATATPLNNTPMANTNGVTVSMLGENSWSEFSIEVPWGTVEGKWWGSRNRQPILALHGWQDNCGSFDRLCPLLPADCSVLAIDLPGHGHSTPYPQGMQYFIFWDGICLIRRIVRKYNWKNVTLMGHSLGGALTFMYAASFPDEVHKLINIDIAGPTVRSVNRMAQGTGKALDKFLDYEVLPESKLPCYKYDEMIQLVLDAYDGSVDEPSVHVLMKRGMRPNKDGYLFARDLRLKVSMLGMFTSEQTLAYARQIRCKVLNIRGMPGMKFELTDFYKEVIDTLKEHAGHVEYVEVPGTHHLHLVTPDRVAPHITKFLMNK
ncbi:kraken [Drosophila busckii]|uniref:Kraken n=1 Tax=Drosophila busckii TaxID=30019 RepID=A0A0M4DZD8_DROBS|nr:probable serine hydrolase [Drosophila busckii]ALC37928.1 kraken [Drosophila busckii]